MQTRKEVAFVEDAYDYEASPMNTVLIMTLSPTARATLPHPPPRALLTFAWPLRRESRSRLSRLLHTHFIADSSRPSTPVQLPAEFPVAQALWALTHGPWQHV